MGSGAPSPLVVVSLFRAISRNRTLCISKKSRPSSYTWPQFQVPNAVYCKAQVGWTPRNVYKQPSPMMYVGSTSLRVSQREWNRMAVVRRIQTNPHVQAELAIRHWNSKRDFQQFTIFKIAHCAAWVLEHQLIQRWQPRLNFPFISRFLQRKALGFRTSSQRRRSVAFRFGKRLWAKLRKRLFGSRLPVSICVSRQQAWEYVFDLQSATKAAFDAARTLRSAKVTDQEVYALLKLTHALEQPGRAKVLGFFGLSASFATCPGLVGKADRYNYLFWHKTALPQKFSSGEKAK